MIPQHSFTPLHLVTGAYLPQHYPDDAPPLSLTLSDAVADVCGLPRGITYCICKNLSGLLDTGLALNKVYVSHLMAGGYNCEDVYRMC